MLPCCWIRCCNSARPIALYWRLQHVSINRCRPCRQFGYLPCPYWRGASAAQVFRGALQLPPQRPAAVRGRQRQRRQGARWRWHWRRLRVRAWDHWWVWHGSSLGDEPAGQVLGRWTSPSAGFKFLEDAVVECGERVAELSPQFVRGHGIGFST